MEALAVEKEAICKPVEGTSGPRLAQLEPVSESPRTPSPRALSGEGSPSSGEYNQQFVTERVMYGGESPPIDQEKPSISVGVCAMNNKTMAPPMQNILQRIQVKDYIKVVMFDDQTILEQPVEEWPVCDCLIAFYSKGFPLTKAIEYVKLRRPLVFNDLEMQFSLMDRREVYKILNANGVETPRYEVYNRDEEMEEESIVLHELDDMVDINGKVFHKPFVEKPVSAEDHNIYIYFPSDYGGGSQRLFRKVKNRSSSYSKESSVRTKGSYIYEDFLATDGTDVKVYTVGPDYAHAEARKSPALDGKVERDGMGKEVRYPVILTAKEKLIARAVCLAFKQTVCGFDLLRANGRSYVCDVNGFSFVKNSQKYYDDCAQILLEMITAYLGPHYFPSIPPSVEYLMDEIPEMPVPIPRVGNNLELRCVVGVIRHGDRTPKQKMKMIVNHKRFFDLFKELNGYETGHLKIKKPKLLQRVLDIARVLLSENGEENIGEKIHKLEQLKTVLEMYGTFSGINRKLQFKLLNKKDQDGGPLLLLILKWGGEHTQSGQQQAEELGRAFRIIYPGGEGEYASLPGSGFLRLHSTYRHDLKVYASDEGRVQMTAGAFTKGLLDLEGNPASVLVHLVKRDQAATNMLDTSTDAQDAMNSVKERLHVLMRSTEDFTQQSFQELAPTGEEPIVVAMKEVKNPHATCEKLYGLIKALLSQLRAAMAEKGENLVLYHEETLQLMVNRWGKLEKDFKLKNGQFDISKIPDIYDCIKYDLLHNSDQLDLKVGKELFRCVMPLADIVMPQEYGLTKEEKQDIAHKICTPLLRKIQADFHHTIVDEQADVIHRLDHRLSKGVVSPKRHVRTRLYFTSESHVHSLTNILKYDGLIQKKPKDSMNIHNIPELNYMTQIVFLLFEDLSLPERSDNRYRVHIHFSPGVKCRDELAAPSDTKKSSPEVVGKSMQAAHFVKRMPADSGVQRRHSSHDNPLDPTDVAKPDVVIVRRQSEFNMVGGGFSTSVSTPPAESRFKSFSETEVQAARKNHAKLAGSAVTQHTDINKNSRSRSLDVLNDVPASPPKNASALMYSRRKPGNVGDKRRKINAKWELQIHPKRSAPSLSELERKSSDQMSQSVSPTSHHQPLLPQMKEELASAPSSQELQLRQQFSKRKTSAPSEMLLSQICRATFKIEESDEFSESGSIKVRPIMGQGSNEKLNRSLNELGLTLVAGGGLVLATELSSAIYPLSPIGKVSLAHMNQYLTTVTGVHLNYDPVVQKDSPALKHHVKVSLRTGSLPPADYNLQVKQTQRKEKGSRDLKARSADFDSIETMDVNVTGGKETGAETLSGCHSVEDVVQRVDEKSSSYSAGDNSEGKAVRTSHCNSST